MFWHLQHWKDFFVTISFLEFRRIRLDFLPFGILNRNNQSFLEILKEFNSNFETCFHYLVTFSNSQVPKGNQLGFLSHIFDFLSRFYKGHCKIQPCSLHGIIQHSMESLGILVSNTVTTAWVWVQSILVRIQSVLDWTDGIPKKITIPPLGANKVPREWPRPTPQTHHCY